MRDYKDLLLSTIRGCHYRYNENNLKAAKGLQTQTGFYNTCLSPVLWSKFFNPIKQTPPCLMHNGPLGLIRMMILQFAMVHGQVFVQHINSMTFDFSFPGVPRAPHGIFCEAKKPCNNKYALRKLNADQIMGFARSSPAFVWQVLPREHFDLWMLILRWFSTLYALEFYRNDLDCGGIDKFACARNDGQCIRHMGRSVVEEWLKVFGHSDFEKYGFSQSFWNLHIQLHMFWYIQQLGPLYLLATDLGESHHAVQKRFGTMTNHKNNSMEAQILKKNHIITAWRFYNGRHPAPAESTTSPPRAIDDRNLHTEESSSAQVIKVIMDVINNAWDTNICEEDVLPKGSVFKKMLLHGHFVGSGDNIAIRHSDTDSTPWFGKIVRFMRFFKVSIFYSAAAYCKELELLAHFL